MDSSPIDPRVAIGAFGLLIAAWFVIRRVGRSTRRAMFGVARAPVVGRGLDAVTTLNALTSIDARHAASEAEIAAMTPRERELFLLMVAARQQKPAGGNEKTAAG